MSHECLALIECAEALSLPVAMSVGDGQMHTVTCHLSTVANDVNHQRQVAIGIELRMTNSDQHVAHDRRVAPCGLESQGKVAIP